MSEYPQASEQAIAAGNLNPLWLRELWIHGRSRRMPVALAGLTVVVALVVCSIGALASLQQEPARVGSLLYQVFFGTAFAWVTWVGTGVAATAIAHETSNRSWDVLVASGASPGSVARGSFAASLTWVLLCLAMLSPVASLSFLFGGVSPSEILAGFLATGVAACLAVGFGVAVGSASSSATIALLIAVPCGALGSMLLYAAGFVSSYVAEIVWPQVPGGLALWWPTALARADADASYWLALVGAPLAAVTLAASFLHEVTVANLTEPSSDRTSRLHYWFIVCGSILYITCGTSTLWLPLEPQLGLASTLAVVILFSLFGCYTLAGEALVPSARVLTSWQQHQVSAWRRFCGPGITRAMLTLCLLAAGGIGVQWIVALASELRQGTAEVDLLLLSVCNGYVLGFVCFLAGFVAFARARSASGAAPRMLLTFVLLAITIGPWILASAFGLSESFSAQNTLLVATPSPFFVVAVALAAPEQGSLSGGLLAAGLLASVAWVTLGLALLHAAQRQVEKASSP